MMVMMVMMVNGDNYLKILSNPAFALTKFCAVSLPPEAEPLLITSCLSLGMIKAAT